MLKKSTFIIGFSVLAASFLAMDPEISRAAQPAATPAPIAVGILTNYAGVVVRNLPIGKSVSMKKLSNLPLTIQSKYPDSIYVTIETAKPVKLLEDYESIPDPAWIKVESTGVTVPAYGEVKVDVVINVPNDETLMGRKFQTNLEIRTNGLKAGFIKFGSHNTDKLFFSVASVKGDQALKDALAKPRDAAFEIIPARVDLYHITAGQKVEVKDAGKPIVIKNTSKKKQTYYLSALEIQGAVAQADPDSQPANPNDLIVSPEEVTLKPGESKPVEITVQVPDGIDLGKGPLFGLISAKSGLQNYAEKYFRICLHAGAKPESEPKDQEKGKPAEKP